MTRAADRDPGDDAPTAREDEVVRLEDLAPRRDVGGGRKITLGERAPGDADDAPGAAAPRGP